MNLAPSLLPAALALFPATQDFVDVPTAEHAVPDTPVPDQFRPVLDIHYDGRIVHDREVLYDPEVDDARDDPFEKLRTWTSVAAKRMERDYIDKELGAGPRIPDEPILLRPDRSAPFRYVQKCMETCGHGDVQIWKIQLAARTPDGEAGRLAAYLPKDIGVHSVDAEPVEKFDLRVKVLEPGTRLEPTAAGKPRKVATPDTGRFVYDDDRELEYTVGPFKTTDLGALKKRLPELREASMKLNEGKVPLTIDARPGTIYEDVIEILDVALAAGFVDITFAGAYEVEDE